LVSQRRSKGPRGSRCRVSEADWVAVVHRETTAVSTLTRWRAACGWFGIVAGVAVFVAALAVSLDDPALAVAVMLTLRSGRAASTA
jgi:hypothetical protein